MDNLQPVSKIDPKDVPEGFTFTDPNSSSSDAAAAAAAQASRADEQKQAVLEQALTPEALARLNRIRLVKPDRAERVSNAIAGMALSGKLPGRISEGKLIEMLERGSARDARAARDSQRNPISIQRKKYAMDSDDDEDDNDDDL